MQTIAVIVAAGLSSRMKSFKPLLPLGGATVIQTGIQTLLGAGAERVVVVTGKNAAELSTHVAQKRVECLMNEDYAQTDMFASVCLGLGAALKLAERIFFLPADLPLFATESLFAMQSHMDKTGCDIVVPAYLGKRGHPLLIKATAAESLLEYKGTEGLRGAIEEYGGQIETLELPDLGLILDADKPEDYALLNNYAKSKLLEIPVRCAAKVSFSRKCLFFGDEQANLLRQVEKSGSLSRACRDLGMSYSNGWNTVKMAESQLGFALLLSKRGGMAGGGSALTEQARRLLQLYAAFRQEIDRHAELKFLEYFTDVFIKA